MPTPSHEEKRWSDRTFRTQQRAQTDPHPRPGFPLPHPPKQEGVVLTRPAADAGSIVNVPHSRAARPRTNVSAPDAWTKTPEGDPAAMLLRKEVIQPHLPVRLPCYDFVPIADPTFDGSFHKG